MKKYLLTFIALFLTSSAFAECALYVEDFEVKQDELGTEIVVPVKAHFSARLNAWQVDLTLPAGLRVTEAESGADQRVTYINSDGQEKKLRPDFSGPSEINRIIAIFMEKGYWQDPNGEDPNAWVPYGLIKWEGGDYNEMILLHLDVSPDFKGGNITFNTLASSTPDSRGGTILENGDENTHFTRICHVKVQNEEPPEPPTPPTPDIEVGAPVITTTMDYDNVYVSIAWPMSSGQHIYTGRRTYSRGEEDAEYEVEAYVTSNGNFLESAHAIETISVPAQVTDAQHMSDPWIVLLDAEGAQHRYKLNDDPDGEDNWYIMITLNQGKWGETIPFYFMVNGTRYGAETDMLLPEFCDFEENVLNPVFEGENMFYVPADYTYTFGLMFTDDEIKLLVAQGLIVGTPPEKTNVPIFYGYCNEDEQHTRIETYFVDITPSEPSTIYYRVFYPNETWSEWTEYIETLNFNVEGKYCIEAYADAAGKDPSDVIEYNFVISSSIEPEDPHMTGKWIVLLAPEGLEYWYELNNDPFDDANCYIMLSLRPDRYGEGDVPFYFMVDGTRYGAETDMQVPEFGDAEENVPNPLFEGENMFCVPVLYNENTYYTYVFGLQFINDEISLLITRATMWDGSTGDPVFNGYIEDNTYIVEITPSEPGSRIYYRVFYPDETWSQWTEYTEALRFTDDGAYHIEAYAFYYNKFPSDVIEYDFVISASNDVEETMGGKEVAGVRYYNMLGQEMQKANGITIVVTTYTDGTTSAVKVLK